MVTVSARSAGEHPLGEQAFAPDRDQTLPVEVLRMHRPQSHPDTASTEPASTEPARAEPSVTAAIPTTRAAPPERPRAPSGPAPSAARAGTGTPDRRPGRPGYPGSP